ncbi:hypothetical protein M011DRAFT_164948 [Sporormia fimetaria CBS 119925]|uniref:Cora-domain-containing protein n=1 Tax=Sporormia fimetaria CBS 119925 TaxID=1340428 RepID=A0A6A6V2L4_9PLEO|nr:hypothetical protein M011DRAFT_164948 [Sporormia fimetaria CBS 119925]
MEHAKWPNTGQVDWQADPYWRNRLVSPALIQVHDVRLEHKQSDVGVKLEMREVLPSTLLPSLEHRERLSKSLRVGDLSESRVEQNRLQALAAEYGWLNCLRSNDVQKSVNDPLGARKCRWIHVSSKFTNDLAGYLLGLSDWSENSLETLGALRQLDHCVSQNERFSKHGRYFAPFVQDLLEGYPEMAASEEGKRPLFISVPFMDWSVEGLTPPLRFRVDSRAWEQNQSNKVPTHPLRSIMQHFYRLEDTEDREPQQVFTRHKPWLTDRDLDLRVRQWYGHYPRRLAVDELWILVVDARHVVTFSSNQSWKAQWPPLQLSARISDVSFRGIRNGFLSTAPAEQDYTAYTHVITALSGALGMLHRSFWPDITLCLTDRYAGYLSHLQYRLHRSPSTRLVMDLLQVQEELNIVVQIMDQQIGLVTAVQELLRTCSSETSRRRPSVAYSDLTTSSRDFSIPGTTSFRYRRLSLTPFSTPAAQLLSTLQREHVDLVALRENSNALFNRTIQLVNIRLEDHGKAILVFTIVTIVFLPLSFVSSFFGMNFSDIRDMAATQEQFWKVAVGLTCGTVGAALLFAFYGRAVVDGVVEWREGIKRRGWRKGAIGRVDSWDEKIRAKKPVWNPLRKRR